MWTIGQNRGLINQEHMAVDAKGLVHVLLSHLPDAQADDTNFDSARGKSQYFHYYRDAAGSWNRTAMAFPAQGRVPRQIGDCCQRQLVCGAARFAHCCGACRAGASSHGPCFASSDAGKYFSDPLIDTARLLSEDTLSIFYPRKNSGNIDVLDYQIN